jgi:hypothetical protein
MNTPIDLRAEFGHRWKIGLDEAARGRWTDPWNFKVLCRYGEIVPWGNGLLAASTARAGAVANRLKALAGVEVVHDGDDGATVTFTIAVVKAVAVVMKPRTVRKVSPAQMAALNEGRFKRLHD